MKTTKRILAMLMAFAMVLSLLPATHAHAEQTGETAAAESSSSYEPWAHGYRFVDILNWTPETDDYSEELVAKVPLQERIPTYSATQANPDLIDDAQLYVISSSNYRNTDTTNGPWNAGMAYDEFSYNVFKFWQYTDITGAGGRPTEQIDEETKNYIGSFEYGTIAIPQASATNAAHLNGVLSIGEYFVPRNPQYTEEWLYQAEDGTFPYAQKLIDIMNHYGFDGYFINQEENIPASFVPLFRDMLVWMREQGAYIQWYDSIGDSGSISYQNAFNDYNDSWVWNEEDGRVSDSIFLNYWYSSSALKNSKARAESLGLDPYEVVFMGVEGGQWKFGTDIESRYNAVDENGQPYTSFAIWGSDWYQDQYDRADDARYKDAYQWGVEERERIYFTSATENAGTYSTGTVTRDDIEAGTINFQGFSKYVVEKSVIDGTVFASDFNNGHGMQYFRGGEVSRDMEWANLNVQDVLPTWQWWIQSEGESLTLEMDWDYGTKHTRHQGAFPYTQVGAYNGGSSIVVYGDLADTHTVNLYKTALTVTADSSIALTYHKASADDASQIGIAVTFQTAEGGTETVVLPIADSGAQTGWTTAEVDLGEYAGKVIAAIGLELSAAEAVEDYQINLGRLVVSDGADHTPAAPTGVTLEKNFDSTNEVQISWDLAGYGSVVNYHIYAIYADASEKFVGGAYAENYYIQTLEDRANVVALEVRAVGADGSESAGTRVALTNPGISSIKAASADNQLVVTWDGGEATVALEYWYCDKEAPAAQTGNGTVTFDVEVEDGEEYILTLTNSAGSIHYFGALADKHCNPYEGQARKLSTGTYQFTMPLEGDWYTMDMNINGSVTTYKRFGGSSLESVTVGSDGISTVTITLTDLYGNVSEPVTMMFLDGEIADLTGALSPEQFPDENLRKALEETVGATLQDLLDFTGELDLSGSGIADLTGLSVLAGVTGLDLSGNAFTELTADVLPSALEALTLDGSEVLTSINLDGCSTLALTLGDLPALTELSATGYGQYPLDLSGCPELQNLYLTGTAMTELDITACTKLHNFMIDDSQIAKLTAADASAYPNAYYWVWTGAKLDLSAGTDEGALMTGLKAFFETNEFAPEISPFESVLLSAGSWYGYNGKTKIMDLGSSALLSSITFQNSYANYYGSSYSLTEATVSVSDDGETYTDVLDFTDAGTAANVTIELPEGTQARFVKLTTTKSSFYTGSWQVNGYAVAPIDFTYGSQQPAMAKDDIQTMLVDADGQTYQLKTLLENYYASAHTLASGTYSADLAAADWIDAAYLAEQSEAPKGVKVVITDQDGNTYEYPTEGPTLGNIETTKLNVPADTVYTASEYSNEEGYRMFDGLSTTKWCGSQSGNWLVFQLEEPRVLGQWYTMHAGSEDRGMISAAFRLQVLNPDVITDEEYLAMDANGKRNVARSASNWKDLSAVTGNTENEVTVEVDFDGLATAQVYRFLVDQAAQPDGNAWGALRVYEMALYAYEGQLGANTNGLLKADTAGKYDVSFEKAGQTLNQTVVIVGDDTYTGCEHVWEENGTVTLDPTCTEQGEMTFCCQNDPSHIRVVKVDALGHDFTGEWIFDETGHWHECTRCGIIDEVVGHDQVFVAASAPTCTEPGLTAGTKCSVCGFVHDAQVAIPALGHTWDEGTVTQEATCSADGVLTYTCSVCDETRTETIPALGHTWDEGTVTVEATCTAEGEMTYTCSVCGETRAEPIAKTEHVCTAQVVEPTCEAIGYTVYTCQCGYSYIGSITAALGHSYESVVTEATCDKMGFTTHTCSACGHSYIDSYVEATDHEFEMTVTKEATCCEEGEATFTCIHDGCTETYTMALPVSENAHQLSSVVYNATCLGYGYTEHSCQLCGYSFLSDLMNPLGHDYRAVVTEATCTEGGYTTHTCSRCGDRYFDSHTAALGHTSENGPCSRCGIGVVRIAGADRVKTSLMLAAEMKAVLDAEKFGAIVVASAMNFPDALTGSYLAIAKGAPILLTAKGFEDEINAFIAENLAEGGTVYVLGGESAVPDALLEGVPGVKRVAGEDRFGTNLAILAEAGVAAGQPVLIATAVNFADSLSASAAGLPMVLVYGELTEEQKEFLETTSKNFIIIGGTAAVSEELEAELKEIGTVERLAGEGRYETSVLVAQRFITDPASAVLAYARNYPDGLCGGPLAFAMRAPLILTDAYGTEAADAYVEDIVTGIVVGGESLISDDEVREIFDMAGDAVIETK